MSIDPELVERMVKLVRGVVETHKNCNYGFRYEAGPFIDQTPTDVAEARAIAALLPDPDMAAAERIADELSVGHRGLTLADLRNAAFNGIRHGRGERG